MSEALGGADADLARGAAVVPMMLVLGILLRPVTVKDLGVSSPRCTTMGIESAVLVTMRQMTVSPMPMKCEMGWLSMERILSPAPQARFIGGQVRLDVANDGGGLGIAHRLADDPDDAREEEREAEAEERSRERDDDFLPGRRGRKLLARRFGLALDGLHRRHLRQRDIAAGGDGAENVFDAVDFFRPERLAEPDGELVDLQAAPARGEKMAELVDDDQDVEEQYHFRERDDGKEDRADAVAVGQRNGDGQEDRGDGPKRDAVEKTLRGNVGALVIGDAGIRRGEACWILCSQNCRSN